MSDKICANCGASNDLEYEYCCHCGQKFEKIKKPFLGLISEVIISIFGVDGKLWNSLKYLFKPWFLAEEYFRGKRIKYLNPVRLFIFTLIIHISALMFTADFDDLINVGGYNKMHSLQLAENYDTIMQDYQVLLGTENVDTIKHKLFGKSVKDTTFLGSINVGSFTDISKYKINVIDAYTKDVDELIDKYEVQGFWDKLILRQSVKFSKNRKEAVKYGIANLFWTLILVVFLLAGFMKLLYYRQDRFYIENLVFLFNIHSTCFLAASLAFIIDHYIDSGFLVLAIYSLCLLLSLWSFKRYYKQGKFKTFVKFALSGLAYVLIFIVLGSVAFLFSLAIF